MLVVGYRMTGCRPATFVWTERNMKLKIEGEGGDEG
jgi:hypothetical protein